MTRLTTLRTRIAPIGLPARAPLMSGNKERTRLAPWRQWYGTWRWKQLRTQQLRDEPLCRKCAAQGRVRAAGVCDHVEPHRGDEVKFWAGPFQSLCKPCHDGEKQAEEQGQR